MTLKISRSKVSTNPTQLMDGPNPWPTLCRTRRLNQALSVLSLSLDFLNVSTALLTRAAFALRYFVLFVYSWLFLLGCQYQCK